MDRIEVHESENRTETMTIEGKDDISEESFVSKCLTAKNP